MARHPMATMADRRGRRADVARDMARLKGLSNAQLERDDKRGATSPLGMGKKEERRKRI